jgi:hypothetical protein
MVPVCAFRLEGSTSDSVLTDDVGEGTDGDAADDETDGDGASIRSGSIIAKKDDDVCNAANQCRPVT